MSHLDNQLDNMFNSGESEREILIEELETLRASNTIKQANIERLEAELTEERKDKVFFKNQFEDLRNSWDNAMINIGKMCGEDLTDEPRFKLASLAVSNVVSERDRLKAENANLKLHKEYDQALDQLITDRDTLLEQNAKLIADQSVNLNSLAKSFGDEFIVDPEYYYISNAIEHLIKDRLAMQAEREAMMKQTHKRADELLVGDHIKKFGEVVKIFQITNNGGYIKINFEETHLPPEALIEMAYDPLPAQQIPEGCALVPIEPTDAMVEMGARNIFSYGTVDRSAKEVYKAMLSASQPKGDV